MTAGNPRQDRRAGLAKADFHGRMITAYDPGVALIICEEIADGKSLTEICSREGMPARSTFHRWRLMNPELDRAYQTARELSAETMEEQALALAAALTKPGADFTGTKVRAYEVAMGQLRWSAARRDPRRYGGTTTDKVVIPIQINTTLDLAEGPAKTGVGLDNQHPNVYTIEAKVYAEEPPVEDPDPIDPEDDPLAVPSTREHVFKKPPRPRVKKGHKSEALTKKQETSLKNRARTGKLHPRVVEILAQKDPT